MAEKIPLLQQLKTHVAVERNSSFALYLFDRAIARIEELEASLAERESTWRTAREEQWKRENPMGSTPIETLPIREFEKAEAAEDKLQQRVSALEAVLRKLRDGMHYDGSRRVYSVSEAEWFSVPYRNQSPDALVRAVLSAGPKDTP